MMFAVLVLLALLGAPLFIVIAMSAMLGYARSGISLSSPPVSVFGRA